MVMFLHNLNHHANIYSQPEDDDDNLKNNGDNDEKKKGTLNAKLRGWRKIINSGASQYTTMVVCDVVIDVPL